jgi:hypothetical protein
MIMKLSTLAFSFLAVVVCEGCQGATKNKPMQSVMVGSEGDALSEVGVIGSADFDPRKHYSIVLAPTVDASSPTGVRIPGDMMSAADELRVALPSNYIRSLRLISNTSGASYCVSPDEKIDQLVIRWLKYGWNLRDPSSPLVLQSGFEPRGELYPDLVANAVITRLCSTALP